SYQRILESLPLRDLIETLLGAEGKRRIMLRQMTNDELFKLYDSDIVLRLHNAKNLSSGITVPSVDSTSIMANRNAMRVAIKCTGSNLNNRSNLTFSNLCATLLQSAPNAI
ncbi:MAG: hypothetical protein NTZ34_04385, partial [Chloroflexi bacterium]|nr:hypothetical protein [Chloroflexota bacterium]